ncbi:M16 family metallopeptidase [Aquabacterium parvum]|uniref:M16 family metallopeptidase n=1 Tax=Aquabacterium parvum TaxID=70584 RepID=UPI000718BDF9|nr:pitrilysin family protein [Aquabacterium parvum]
MASAHVTKAGKAADPWLPVAQAEGISEWRLPNGLQVLLIPDAARPTTTVNLTYRVGSRHEGLGETGMAHLLEHLLFKGSPKHPKVWAEFTQRGLSANGSTWLDRTNYYASFAANEDNLRWYLNWQADAMVNSFIARKDLDSEMTVVRNEMEMGENSPGRVLLEKTLATMYQWHNYGKSTIGARTDVEGVDISQLQAFYRRHYRPDNATLIVSGRFDVPRTLAWIRNAFAPIAKPKAPLREPYTLDPVQDGERSVTLRRSGGVPLLYAGYHVMPGVHADHAAVALLSLILGDTPSGRLHKQLSERRLAASTFAFSQGLADPGFLIAGVQLGVDQEVGPAREALLKAVESFASQPVTEAELARAKARWLKDWQALFADPQHVGVALSESVAQGDWRLFFLNRDRVRDIKLADVQRVAAAYLVRSNRTLGEYVPTAQPVRAPAPARVDLAEVLKGFKPQAAADDVAPFDATPANIDARTQRFDLPPGMKVALLPKPTRSHAVQATLVFHHGTSESLANWGEAPSALAELLDQGTQTMSRQALQDRLDALQTEVSVHASAGQLAVTLSSRREHLLAAISVVADMLRRPLLPAEGLEEVRRQALSAIEAQRKEPSAVLAEALSRHGDPYPAGDVRHARSFDEMAADWRGVNLAQVQAFHRRFLSASHARVGIVGDFDVQQVRQALSEAFGDWGSHEARAPIAMPLLSVPAVSLSLQTPDKQNATMVVRLGMPVNDSHPDYPALMMANHLMGGGGDARLWRRIREQEGLSYSVHSAIEWGQRDLNSQWVVSAIFAPQNRLKVERAFQEELERSLANGFTQAELSAAQGSLLSFRQLGRANDGRLASAWANNLELGRDFSLSDRVDAALRSLTLDQVNDVWRRHIRPEAFVRGVAGDFASAP